MDKPFDYEEEWEWEKLDYSRPIVGQMSFFPPEISSFFNKKENKDNLSSSFEDIIYKNPAYTIGELEELDWLAETMDVEDDCA